MFRYNACEGFIEHITAVSNSNIFLDPVKASCLVGTSQKWPSIVIDHSQLFGVTVYIILLTGRLDNGLI